MSEANEGQLLSDALSETGFERCEFGPDSDPCDKDRWNRVLGGINVTEPQKALLIQELKLAFDSGWKLRQLKNRFDVGLTAKQWERVIAAIKYAAGFANTEDDQQCDLDVVEAIKQQLAASREES